MRDLKSIAILLILAIGALILLTSHAGASYVSVTALPADLPAGEPGELPAIEVHQGGPDTPETLYRNETANLDLVKGWYDIVERYPGGEMVDVSGYSDHILIDQEKFPVGVWYQWSPEGLFDAGNNIAFEVREGERPIRNLTFANVSGNETAVAPGIAPEVLPLPRAHMADYYISRGDGLSIKFPNQTAQVWVIGSEGENGLVWLPPVIARNETFFYPESTQKLPPGENYTVLIQDLGPNGVADLVYKTITRTREDGRVDNVIVSPFDPSNETIVNGLQPGMIYAILLHKIADGMWVDQGMGSKNIFDDTLNASRLVVEEPSAEIVELNEKSRGNATLDATIIQVNGYTNLHNGSKVWIALDYDPVSSGMLDPKNFKWEGDVIGREIGDKRQFSATITLYYRDLSPGPHFLTVITPAMTSTTVSFHVYDMPEGQVKPLATKRYIGGDEFRPTPSPEIIRETVEVTKIRYVQVTPPPTPTPTPPPLYTQPPWSYAIGSVVGCLVMGIFGWVLWKWF